MKQNLPKHNITHAIPLTLQLRLALWTSGLFVVLCLILVTFINVATILLQPHQLLTISTVGFFFVTIGGGFGAYWIAGISLRPVKKMSEAATLISASTLSTRLSFPGPQDELHTLAASFDAMLDRLEQAFEQQSRFVADAAHELRTPLATLRTNLEVTRRNAHVTLSDYQSLFVIVERAVIRLEHLVAALLVLATEKQAIKLEAISPLPLLEEVLSDLQPTASAHQVTLHLEAYAISSLYGDEHLLTLVFRNLIENGIRYNHPGGTVTITVNDASTGVHICIADTGTGIAREDQPHIFERFYRVDRSRSRHKGGAGLGLSIVQHLLSLHNGSISLKESSPAGSSFLVQLPTYAGVLCPAPLRERALVMMVDKDAIGFNEPTSTIARALSSDPNEERHE